MRRLPAGSVRSSSRGFFLIDLVRTDGAWKIARFAVYNDIPGQGMPLTREPPRA